MKKEFILFRIEAVQDGSPYVNIAFVDPNETKSGEARQQNPFGSNPIPFSSPEEFTKGHGIYCRNDWWKQSWRFPHIQVEHEGV